MPACSWHIQIVFSGSLSKERLPENGMALSINLQQGFDGGGVLRQARHFFFEFVLAAGVVERSVD